MIQQHYEERRGNGSRIPARGTVLLVDEDRADLQYYGVILRAFGYQVRICASYKEGVQLLGSQTFGIVIVSQGGSKFEGRCVLERAVEIDRYLPVLVVARYLDIACYLEAIQLGAVDYLAGSVTTKGLDRAVGTHIRVPPPIKPASQVSKQGAERN